MKTVVASGYFNPLHKGHIEYLRMAKRLGDYLIVILNTDEQVKVKGSKPFMDINEREIILGAIRYVDEIVISVDTDLTVCESLKLVRKLTPGPFIFAKGGDRFGDEIPEAEICKELNIKIVDGLGGKIQSSSALLK